TICSRDWSSDVCSSDLAAEEAAQPQAEPAPVEPAPVQIEPQAAPEPAPKAPVAANQQSQPAAQAAQQPGATIRVDLDRVDRLIRSEERRVGKSEDIRRC